MKLFDVKYLHDSRDNAVKLGTKVFYADTLKEIITRVNEGTFREVLVSLHAGYRLFEIANGKGRWVYVYYDPNYDVKVAFIKGKPIEYRSDKVWYTWELDEEPDDWDKYQWRVAETPKPQTDFRLGDVVRLPIIDIVGVITALDNGYTPPKYFVAGKWYDVYEIQSVDAEHITIGYGNDSPLGCSSIKGEVTAREDDKENE